MRRARDGQQVGCRKAKSSSLLSSKVENTSSPCCDSDVVGSRVGVDKAVAIATNDLITKLCEVGAMWVVWRYGRRIEVGCETRNALDLVSTAHEAGLRLLDEAHVWAGDTGTSLWVDTAKARLVLGEADEYMAS